MPATNKPRHGPSDDNRQSEDARTTSTVEADNQNNANADLYTTALPAYTQVVVDNEASIDAEDSQDSKSEVNDQTRLLDFSLDNRGSLPQSTPNPPKHTAPQEQEHHQQALPSDTSMIAFPKAGHYLTELATNAALAGVRKCSILLDRPAIWLVKGKTTALSPLAAAVLVQEGHILPQNLELIPQLASAKRDPTDPLSGIMLGVYDAIEEIMQGLIAGPIEISRQADPTVVRYNIRLHNHREEGRPSWVTRYTSSIPPAVSDIAVSAGKGLGRIVTASLKSPMLVLHGVTRGFHNLPKLYGEEVREYENVTDLKSGLLVSAKSLGYGIGDGLMDLVVKPIEGAEQGGVKGFGIGLAKGIGNAICKPVAGSCGMAGYSSVGIYESVRNLEVFKLNVSSERVNVLAHCELEYANEEDRLYIVRRWGQISVHPQEMQGRGRILLQ